MEDDWNPGRDFDPDNDAAVFYSVPSDHPAFRLPQDDGDDEAEYGEPAVFPVRPDSPGGNILELPVGRYDRFSGQSHEDQHGVSGTGDARPGTDEQFIRDKLEQRARERGNRSVREHALARQHQPSVDEGATDSGRDEEREPTLSDLLASSLNAAGINFREQLGRSGDPAFIATAPDPDSKRAVSLVRSRAITKPPVFKLASLRGQLGGLKSNSSGTWILTLAIDPDCVEEVTKLGSAHGLALDIVISKKTRD